MKLTALLESTTRLSPIDLIRSSHGFGDTGRGEAYSFARAVGISRQQDAAEP